MRFREETGSKVAKCLGVFGGFGELWNAGMGDKLGAAKDPKP